MSLRPWSKKAISPGGTRQEQRARDLGQALGEDTTGKSPAQETGGAGLRVPFPDFGAEVLAPAPAENP